MNPGPLGIPCSAWFCPLLTVLLSGSSSTTTAIVPAAVEVLAVTGGRYLDVRAGVLRANGAIVVRDGRIVALHSPEERWRPPSGARVVSAEGRSILPGLIDTHVHLTLGPDPGANAAATLRAGFTTVVDLGSAGGAGTRLRDAVSGSGLRVIAGGSWIGAKGGVCEFGGATVGSPAQARARARADLASGADLLKVCVTGWPADAIAHPDSVEFGGAALAAVLDVAAEARRPVFAHAIGQAGALLAARSGVRALAHTPVVDSAGAAALRRSGVRVISTLATLARGEPAGRVRQSFERLVRAGVPIVLGTDAGVLPHGRNAAELTALTGAGLTPVEALRSATLRAAELIGVPGLGEIAVGAAGDFLIVEGDPLQDVSVVQAPVSVVRGGRVVAGAGS